VENTGLKSLAAAGHFCAQEMGFCDASVQKYFHNRSVKPQIPRLRSELVTFLYSVAVRGQKDLNGIC
jgi:hypothetical protein